ncbi:hypothetical protein IV72_GL000557 [Atopobium minutum]|nr:hypothetical protein IV72_GL000557 [Atopobium minutum]
MENKNLKHTQDIPAKKRANSYGEKTSRYITSSTYERAQRRTKKAVDNWFGRGM